MASGLGRCSSTKLLSTGWSELTTGLARAAIDGAVWNPLLTAGGGKKVGVGGEVCKDGFKD